MCTKISRPFLVFKPIACFVGKTLSTFPATGETTSPSVGLIPKPSPIIFWANTGSGISSILTYSPVNGAYS